MKKTPKSISENFATDPLGYSSLAWHKWGVFATENGFPIDISTPPSVEDLKNPVLWLSHAHALSEAAVHLVRNPPKFEHIPLGIRTICHSQYHAVALMLVGYSLEVCLKAMILIRLGPEKFTQQEQNYFHHKLEKLAGFIPDLSAKDVAMLKGLSHYVVWAGRYPDPGSKRISNAVDVFEIAESNEITASELFALSARVMSHVRAIIS